MSELLSRSIRVLSEINNTPNGLDHAIDEARAKELLIALYEAGEILTFSSINQLALSNNWSPSHAKRLAELAEKIGSGHKVTIKHVRNWGLPTVNRIKEEIESENQ